MMHFSGYSYKPELTKRNKNLKLITDPNEYNDLAISWLIPNYGDDCSGFTIPKIIPPYQVHDAQTREKLDDAITLGQVGSRSPYPARDQKVKALLSKSNSQCMSFFKYKKPTWPYEKQVGYDRAVMLGNHDEITNDEQVDRHKKQQALLHELKTSFSFFKPQRIKPDSFSQLPSNFCKTPSEHTNTNSP